MKRKENMMVKRTIMDGLIMFVTIAIIVGSCFAFYYINFKADCDKIGWISISDAPSRCLNYDNQEN